MKRKLVFRRAGTLVTGMNTHKNLPFTHTTVAMLMQMLAAASQRGRVFAKARVWTRKTRRQRINVAAAAQVFALIRRQILVPALGSKWSSDWIPAGWDENTLTIPDSAESLAELFHSLTEDLTEHLELANEKYNVTADECQKQLDALAAAIGGRTALGCAAKELSVLVKLT